MGQGVPSTFSFGDFILFFNLNFVFQLHFKFNTILYSFEVHNIVVRQSHTLQSGPPMCPVPARHHTQILRH